MLAYQAPIPVVLSTERDGTTDTSNYEPEFVKVRAPNTYYVFLDSSDAYLDKDKTNFVFTSANKPGTNPAMLINRTKRIALVSMYFRGELINVTPRNNVLTFHWNGADYSATIPMGTYTDALVLMTSVITAMNTAVGSPEFSVVLKPNFLKFYVVTSASFAYRFTGGTAVTKGSSVYGFHVGSLSLTSEVGPVNLEYPSRVFLTSTALCQYVKHTNTNTFNSSNCIYEIRPRSGLHLGGSIELSNLAWINFEHVANISAIDVQLSDEYGEPVYLYKPYADSEPLQWSMTLLCEM